MMEKTIKEWGIYETAMGEYVLVFRIDPLVILSLTDKVADYMVLLSQWMDAGLPRPAAVILEPQCTCGLQSLGQLVGVLGKEDAMRVATEYAKLFLC